MAFGVGRWREVCPPLAQPRQHHASRAAASLPRPGGRVLCTLRASQPGCDRARGPPIACRPAAARVDGRCWRVLPPALQIHGSMVATCHSARHGVGDVEDACWQLLLEVLLHTTDQGRGPAAAQLLHGRRTRSAVAAPVASRVSSSCGGDVGSSSNGRASRCWDGHPDEHPPLTSPLLWPAADAAFLRELLLPAQPRMPITTDGAPFTKAGGLPPLPPPLLHWACLHASVPPAPPATATPLSRR